MPAEPTIAVASYNIHSCVGRDGRKLPERTARMLRALSADVIGIQEVESHEPSGEDSHQLDYLARETGCRGIAGPTIHKTAGHYGNALLTRERVVSIVRHELSRPGREPRGALDVTLHIRGRNARFLVTHLGLGPAERRSQIDAILEILSEGSTSLTVLLGDFNEWFPWSRSRRRLRKRLGDIPMPATFPSWRPLFALDHVWVQPRVALESLTAVDEPLARIASDHLPVRALVALGGVGTERA